jgi:hypothetical protein
MMRGALYQIRCNSQCVPKITLHIPSALVAFQSAPVTKILIG